MTRIGVRPLRSKLASYWRRSPGLCLWTGLIVVLILLSAFGPLFLQPPNTQQLAEKLQAPSGAHWLGTDDYGRDVLSRVVSAGRVSLGLGAAVTVSALLLGSVIGLVAGFYERSAGVLLRVIDALQSFPVIILAIAIAVGLNDKVPSGVGILIALTAVYTPLVARVVRSRTIVLARTGYVAAAKASGVRGVKILLRHVAPNAFPAIVVQATFVYASALLSDAALGFLGLGIAPPTPTWGNMVADAKSSFEIAPWYMIAPGLAIVIAVAALSLAGDGLRVLVDPRARALADLQRIGSRRRRRGVSTQGASGYVPSDPTHDLPIGPTAEQQPVSPLKER
ncbi:MULTISPECIES: ABC transporter permease [Micromonospora]|uniref:ABC transporter permease n=1 Tax=Micromonospora TaxID=1873 RepID=UPI001AE1CC3B|nr:MULTISPECIES: ABC transporter permease [unclassified Micromonospora]MBP1782052.1 peptide/nickel transport system permease protein [Micromonospora sp. HB375]MDH6470873.1 peptide/nickel transport system permease protein [Micromonospora sp. H404/HB375]